MCVRSHRGAQSTQAPGAVVKLTFSWTQLFAEQGFFSSSKKKIGLFGVNMVND
jgi:hypothetical protein